MQGQQATGGSQQKTSGWARLVLAQVLQRTANANAALRDAAALRWHMEQQIRELEALRASSNAHDIRVCNIGRPTEDAAEQRSSHEPDTQQSTPSVAQAGLHRQLHMPASAMQLGYLAEQAEEVELEEKQQRSQWQAQQHLSLEVLAAIQADRDSACAALAAALVELALLKAKRLPQQQQAEALRCSSLMPTTAGSINDGAAATAVSAAAAAAATCVPCLGGQRQGHEGQATVQQQLQQLRAAQELLQGQYTALQREQMRLQADSQQALADSQQQRNILQLQLAEEHQSHMHILTSADVSKHSASPAPTPATQWGANMDTSQAAGPAAAEQRSLSTTTLQADSYTDNQVSYAGAAVNSHTRGPSSMQPPRPGAGAEEQALRLQMQWLRQQLGVARDAYALLQREHQQVLLSREASHEHGQRSRHHQLAVLHEELSAEHGCFVVANAHLQGVHADLLADYTQLQQAYHGLQYDHAQLQQAHESQRCESLQLQQTYNKLHSAHTLLQTRCRDLDMTLQQQQLEQQRLSHAYASLQATHDQLLQAHDRLLLDRAAAFAMTIPPRQHSRDGGDERCNSNQLQPSACASAACVHADQPVDWDAARGSPFLDCVPSANGELGGACTSQVLPTPDLATAGHDSGSCSMGSGMQHEEANGNAVSHLPPTHRLDASSVVSPDGVATSQLHAEAPAEAALDTIASSVAQCSDGPPSPPPGPATPPQGPLLDTLTQRPLHVIQPTSLPASAADRASQVVEPLPAFQHEDTLVEAYTGFAAAQAAHVPAVHSSSGQAMEPAAPATSLSTPSVSGPRQAQASAGWDREVMQACTATDPLPPLPEAPFQQDMLLKTPVAQLRQQQQGSSLHSGSGSMAPSAELLQMAPVQHRPDEQQQTGTGMPRTPIPPTLPVQPKFLETSFDEEEQEMRMADTCRHLQGMANEAVRHNDAAADADAADTGCPMVLPPAQRPVDCNCSSGLTDEVVLHGASARLSVSAIAVSNVVQGSHSSSTTAAATTSASLEGAQSEEQVPRNQLQDWLAAHEVLQERISALEAEQAIHLRGKAALEAQNATLARQLSDLQAGAQATATALEARNTALAKQLSALQAGMRGAAWARGGRQAAACQTDIALLTNSIAMAETIVRLEGERAALDRGRAALEARSDALAAQLSEVQAEVCALEALLLTRQALASREAGTQGRQGPPVPLLPSAPGPATDETAQADRTSAGDPSCSVADPVAPDSSRETGPASFHASSCMVEVEADPGAWAKAAAELAVLRAVVAAEEWQQQHEQLAAAEAHTWAKMAAELAVLKAVMAAEQRQQQQVAAADANMWSKAAVEGALAKSAQAAEAQEHEQQMQRSEAASVSVWAKAAVELALVKAVHLASLQPQQVVQQPAVSEAPAWAKAAAELAVVKAAQAAVEHERQHMPQQPAASEAPAWAKAAAELAVLRAVHTAGQQQQVHLQSGQRLATADVSMWARAAAELAVVKAVLAAEREQLQNASSSLSTLHPVAPTAESAVPSASSPQRHTPSAALATACSSSHSSLAAALPTDLADAAPALCAPDTPEQISTASGIQLFSTPPRATPMPKGPATYRSTPDSTGCIDAAQDSPSAPAGALGAGAHHSTSGVAGVIGSAAARARRFSAGSEASLCYSEASLWYSEAGSYSWQAWEAPKGDVGYEDAARGAAAVQRAEQPDYTALEHAYHELLGQVSALEQRAVRIKTEHQAKVTGLQQQVQSSAVHLQAIESQLASERAASEQEARSLRQQLQRAREVHTHSVQQLRDTQAAELSVKLSRQARELAQKHVAELNARLSAQARELEQRHAVELIARLDTQARELEQSHTAELGAQLGAQAQEAEQTHASELGARLAAQARQMEQSHIAEVSTRLGAQAREAEQALAGALEQAQQVHAQELLLLRQEELRQAHARQLGAPVPPGLESGVQRAHYSQHQGLQPVHNSANASLVPGLLSADGCKQHCQQVEPTPTDGIQGDGEGAAVVAAAVQAQGESADAGLDLGAGRSRRRWEQDGQQQLLQVQRQLVEAQEEVAEGRRREEALQADARRAEQMMLDGRRREEGLGAEVQAQRYRVEELLTRLRRAESDVAQAQDAAACVERDAAARAQASEARAEAATRKVAVLQCRLEQAAQEAVVMQGCLELSGQEQAQLQGRLANALEEVARLRATASAAQCRLAELEHELEAAQQRVAAAQHCIQQLNAACSAAVEQAQDEGHRAARAQSKLHAAQLQLVTQVALAQGASQCLAPLQHDLSAAMDQVLSLEEALSRLGEEAARQRSCDALLLQRLRGQLSEAHSQCDELAAELWRSSVMQREQQQQQRPLQHHSESSEQQQQQQQQRQQQQLQLRETAPLVQHTVDADVAIAALKPLPVVERLELEAYVQQELEAVLGTAGLTEGVWASMGAWTSNPTWEQT